MRRHADFEADAAGVEGVTAAAVLAVNKAHKLTSTIAVVVGWAVCVTGHVPTGTEDQEVRQRGCGVSGLCGNYAKD